MSDDPDLRTVSLERTEQAGYVIRNIRGGEVVVGTAEGDRFTPVELFLGALAACGAIDLDLITSKRAQPLHLRARAEGHKVRDELGSRLVDLTVTFDVSFPDTDAGDEARAVVPRTIEQIEERLCTVSRTVAVGTPVATKTGNLDRR
jgi:putative redox protein